MISSSVYQQALSARPGTNYQSHFDRIGDRGALCVQVLEFAAGGRLVDAAMPEDRRIHEAIGGCAAPSSTFVRIFFRLVPTALLNR